RRHHAPGWQEPGNTKEKPVIPPSFEYYAPRSIGEAISLLTRLGGESKLLAGGHSLLPMMKLRFAQPAHLIDLNPIPDLRGLRQGGAERLLGAMTTEAELIGSSVIRNKVPLLAEGASSIADPQVRYKGTIGGDISHGDPGNDQPALMLALDASFVLTGPNGQRTVRADGYFLRLYETQLAAREVLYHIHIPNPAPAHCSSD